MVNSNQPAYHFFTASSFVLFCLFQLANVEFVAAALLDGAGRWAGKLRRGPKVFFHKGPGGGKNTSEAQHLKETGLVLFRRVFFPRAHKDGGVEKTSRNSN
jgi:hypothetical protein